MNQKAEVSPLNAEDVDKHDIVLKTNLRFQCDNAMFRMDALEVDDAECLAMQSRNSRCERPTTCKFDDLNVVKEAIAKHLRK